jgi:glutaredoxin-related protein
MAVFWATVCKNSANAKKKKKNYLRKILEITSSINEKKNFFALYSTACRMPANRNSANAIN